MSELDVTERGPGVRISCVIPTLGRGRILCDTVRMLLNQTYQANEIILVDQTASPDKTTQTTLKQWNEDGVIRWLRQEEPNASYARNVGALAATGEVVLFLDDDIVIGAEFLARYADAFANPAIKAVAGQILERGQPALDLIPERATDPNLGWMFFPKNLSVPCFTNWMASGNVAIRRDVFLAAGGMDANYRRGAFREESDFAMRFKKMGGQFFFEPRASVYHLGLEGAPEGGSRSWIRNKRIAGWHHCVGDWYFTLKFIDRENWRDLIVVSLRHFIFNRYNISRPWLLLPLFLRWLAALPRAIYLRIRGPRLIDSTPIESC